MELRAPLSGVVVPLAEVPDPVFAGKLAGDGLGIDPTSSEVLAPIAGTVTQLHPGHHALAITAPGGVEVLVHVGLDTVALKGRHFTALVEAGAQVQLGQPLIRFDADAVAREARSLISVVLVTSGAVEVVAPPLVEAGKSVVARARPSTPLRDEGRGREGSRSAPVVLPNASGLHARPAAVLARKAQGFASTVRVLVRGAEANAKSVTSLMGLGTRQGDELLIEATGPDAAEAIDALVKLVKEGAGEAPAAAPPAVVVPLVPRPKTEGVLAGLAASPGLALGRVVQLRGVAVTVPETGGTRAEERKHLEAALEAARRQLETLEAQTPERALLAVQRDLLSDPELLAAADEALLAGKSAAYGWQRAIAAQAKKLESLDQRLLRERAVDVRDVGSRVLQLLVAPEEKKAAVIALPERAVVIAEELTPTQLAAFERGHLAAVCTTTGSSTSHAAIIARGMGVPFVAAIDVAALSLTDGLEVVVDGTEGTLANAPPATDAAAREQLEQRVAREQAEREAQRAAAKQPGQTRDGHRVLVVANVRNLDETREAMAGGAEGVGLLRSEFLFTGRAAAPTEDEQAAIYLAIAQAVGEGRPFVIRTLDVGGDKPLPYLPLPKEANPFLGVRGIRVSLEHRELFRAQLRAILRIAAAGAADVHVMFPMVAGLDEVREARRLLDEERKGESVPLRVGIMVEVPSAVALAELLAREVDFFSIGTNDLTQYTLAIDRGHPTLAKQADALHPAVLRMIDATVKAAEAHARPVHVCGGVASNPVAAPLLVGLGVNELSVSGPSVGAVKAALAAWSLPECEALASEALTLGTTAEVRALLASWRPGGGDTRRLRALRTGGR